jgi:hypothetical protein
LRVGRGRLRIYVCAAGAPSSDVRAAPNDALSGALLQTPTNAHLAFKRICKAIFEREWKEKNEKTKSKMQMKSKAETPNQRRQSMGHSKFVAPHCDLFFLNKFSAERSSTKDGFGNL